MNLGLCAIQTGGDPMGHLARWTICPWIAYGMWTLVSELLYCALLCRITMVPGRKELALLTTMLRSSKWPNLVALLNICRPSCKSQRKSPVKKVLLCMV